MGCRTSRGVLICARRRSFRSSASGRCVLLRPDIGTTLPVFVVDHYEGFETVRPFVDLTDGELDAYLRANVEALQAAAGFHDFEISFVGHGIPGAAIGRRALGAGRYVAKIHGSDLEYAIRPQERYRELAREGLEGAHAVVGPSAEALERCAGLVPEMRDLGRVVPPGVDVAAFRPRPRVEALRDVAARLADDPAAVRGRLVPKRSTTAGGNGVRGSTRRSACASFIRFALPIGWTRTIGR